VVRSSTQHAFIDASPDQVWELVGDPNQHPGWWPDVIEAECADLREGCRYRGVVKGVFRTGTGVTTRFTLAEAQGGTFVEGHFAIEPDSIGSTVFGALAGRRIMSSWLQSSLENLKRAAERSAATAG